MAVRRDEIGPSLVLAADTVVCVGRRILPKCEILDEAEDCLRLLSGRAHRVYTGLALVTPSGARRQRLVETRVRFKRLSRDELAGYLASGEWRGKAGGYAIQGLAGAFVLRLIGSYSSVVGLPLAETASLLTGEGYPPCRGWTPEREAMKNPQPPENRRADRENARFAESRATRNTIRSARAAAPMSICIAG